ncbi:MAG: right-handed parallel beta-helix repeat-containing protein [Flavobacteriales bacterium]|nr:right-handed parallel beta-helix repeat-containing protein [Flavobacteriales bacterium]
MRKGKRSRPGLQAWFFALAVPGIALFMLFSLLPYTRMVGQWPLGIRQDEVMAFQAVFDHRPGQHAEARTESFKLIEEGNGAVTLQSSAALAQGQLVPLPGMEAGTAAFAVEFPQDKRFAGATALVFVPADLHGLQALYARAVADSLPVLAPSVQVVKLERGGSKEAPYLMQQVANADYLLEHAAVAMALVGGDGHMQGQEAFRTSATDSIGTSGGASTLRAQRMDTAATVAVALLACAEQRPELAKGAAGAMYDRVSGALTPLYRMGYGSGESLPGAQLAAAFGKAMTDAANQQRVVRLAQRLGRDSARWAARFLAIDSIAVPVLAKGRNLGLVQAEVDRAREQFLLRLFHPDVAAVMGPPVDHSTSSPLVLDPWLLPFRTDKDTIRFVRGKYNIDHDLVLPAGMAVVLEKGTRWFMAPGVSVVVNGELHMRGTDLNPVFIRPQDISAAFGSIAVNGTGNTRVRIHGLRISGGGNLWWEGVRHGGMLSFIGADVQLGNCAIEESFGDASVSARRSAFHMGDCSLTGAHHAFVDLAETHGALERSSFLLPGASTVAAGRYAVHLRSAHMLVRGCTFAELPFTALEAARGGEVLVTGGKFNGNGEAIRVLDGTVVQVDGCEFTGNNKVFVLRRNLPVLGGAVLKLYANTFANNGTERDADSYSKVETGGTLGAQALKDFAAARQ